MARSSCARACHGDWAWLTPLWGEPNRWQVGWAGWVGWAGEEEGVGPAGPGPTGGVSWAGPGPRGDLLQWPPEEPHWF